MEDELSCPHDSEVSHDELEFFCTAAKAWRRLGATRRVKITEHSNMVEVTDAQSKASKNLLVKKKKRATITRIWIEQVASDGSILPYRMFERHFVPEGAKDAHRSGMTIEIFDLKGKNWPGLTAATKGEGDEAAG
jgi:hypothetical protein